MQNMIKTVVKKIVTFKVKLPFRLEETGIIITIVEIAFCATRMSLIFWKT